MSGVNVMRTTGALAKTKPNAFTIATGMEIVNISSKITGTAAIGIITIAMER